MTYAPTKEDMFIAFAYFAVTKIIEADDIVQTAELDFVAAVFPAKLLEQRGLFAAGKPTDKFQQALDAAPRELPGTLTIEEKTRITEVFLQASRIDANVDPKEVSVIHAMLRKIGIGGQEAAHIISDLMSEGRV